MLRPFIPALCWVALAWLHLLVNSCLVSTSTSCPLLSTRPGLALAPGTLSAAPIVRIGWLTVIYLIPVLGPLAYFLFGKSEIQRSTRWVLALGAPLAYVMIAVVLLLLVP